MKKIIDISGFGHSGKTAVTDYVKQFPEVFGYPNNIEFEIFRVPDGLLDLYYSIFQSWNLIRSRVRINEYRKLVHRIGRIQQPSDPMSYFFASSHSYNKYFNNKFIEISEKYLENIITGKQDKSFWPYENLRVGPIELFWNKVKARLFNDLVSADLIYSDRNSFLQHTQDYIQALFNEATDASHSHILLNNAFDPFYPEPSLDMVGNGLSIIVERDPRDIYASQINTKDMYIPDFEMTKTADKIRQQFTGFSDIEYFIFRYKTIRENVRVTNDPRIMRLKYEDFVLEHSKYAPLVSQFIGLENSTPNSNTDFNIQVSVKNIGLWKKYKDMPEIIKIKEELGEYCYQ
jgi:hypothetical protein